MPSPKMPETQICRKRKLDQPTQVAHQNKRPTDFGVKEVPKEYQSLCHGCLQLDFHKIFNPERMPPPDGKAVADLGYRSSDWEEDTCSLCQFFATMRVNPSETSGHDASEYHLRLFAFRPAASGAITRFNRKEWYIMQTVCLMVLPGTGRSAQRCDERSKFMKNVDSGWKKGVICLSEDTSSVLTKKTISVRQTQWEHIDYDLLKSWFHYCQRHHPGPCKIGKWESTLWLKVIDCETREIIQTSSGCDYVALSYVWGSSNVAEKPFGPEGPSRLPDVTPSVIQDAITVTKTLGWRYLWVDRYCINQSSIEEKHAQIRAMDKVYAGAVLTIIAAAGRDASFGLPGVGGVARSMQPSVVVRDALLVSSLCPPDISICSSRRASRGWTYQEGMLSKRRLVFTEEQVYFECQVENFCESIIKPQALLKKLERQRCQKQRSIPIQRGYFQTPTGRSRHCILSSRLLTFR